MLIDTLIEHLSEREDPRCPGQVEHRLSAIRVIAVGAVIAGAASGQDRALYGRRKLAGWRPFLALPNGILAQRPRPWQRWGRARAVHRLGGRVHPQ